MNIRSKIYGGEAAGEQSPLVAKKAPKGARTDSLESVKVARAQSQRANTRSGDRHRLTDQQAKVTYKRKSYSVDLINVSGGGAMIEAGFGPMLWDHVDLRLGEGAHIECAVRWIKGARIGLEFAHETQLDCSPDEQAALLREVVRNSFGDVSFAPPKTPVEAEEGGTELRDAKRHPLIWTGKLHYDFTSAPVRLRNISSTGAQVEFTVPLPVGAEPLLDLGDAGSVFTTVTWVVGDQAGLRFAEPFDLSELAKSRPEVAAAKWEAPSYLKDVKHSYSPWDDEWGRMSVSDLQEQLEGFMKR